MQEMWVQSLDQEDLLKEDMATHSSILAWKIPWTEEPSGLQSMELQRVRHDLVTNTHTHILIIKWVTKPSGNKKEVLSQCDNHMNCRVN